MRILKVNLSNLNSLEGRWSIDFSAPAFLGGGLFAITGPTGAGKTTILDAICLALYGRTPRLPRVNKSGNDIMSRGAGECHAEVVFETGLGRYLCHWSQRRARRAPDGELQPPKHEIAEAGSSRLITASARQIAAEVEKAAGLDFHRFTRSMLLAQGDFAAFLRAEPDERAPILERITGSGLYTRISRLVHERRNAAQEHLAAVEKEMAALTPLDENEARRLRLEADELEKLSAERKRLADEAEAALNWRARIEALEKEGLALEARAADLSGRLTAFAASREKLARDARARPLAVPWERLTRARGERERLGGEFSRLEAERPDLARRAASAEAAFKAALAAEDESRVALEAARPLFEAARGLEGRIGEIAGLERAAAVAEAELKKTLEVAEAEKQAQAGAAEALAAELSAVTRLLEETEADDRLIRELAVLRAGFSALRDLRGGLEEARRKAESSEKARRLAAAAYSLRSGEAAGLKDRAAAMRLALEAGRSAWSASAAGREVQAWREEFSALKEKAALAEAAVLEMAELAAAETAEAAGRKKAAESATELTGIRERLARETEHLADLEKYVARLEDDLAFQRRRMSLAEHRAKLVQGRPCPLCGALEHPYAGSAEPAAEADQLETEGQAARERLKALREDITNWKVKEAALARDMAGLTAEAESRRNRAAGLAEALTGKFEKLGAAAGDKSQWPLAAARVRRELADELKRVGLILAKGEEWEKADALARRALEEAQAGLAGAEDILRAASLAKSEAEFHYERDEKEALEWSRRLGQALAELRSRLSAYGAGDWEEEALDRVEADLGRRCDLRQARLKRRDGLSERFGELKSLAAVREAALVKDREQLGRYGAELQELRRRLADLERERRGLFAGKEPPAEEKRLTAAAKEAAEAVKKKRDEHLKAEAALGELERRRAEGQKALGRLTAELADQNKTFAAALAEAGFTDEESFGQALIEPAEREELSARDKALAEEAAVLKAGGLENAARLAEARARRTTEETAEALREVRDRLALEQTELQRHMGAVGLRLAEHGRLLEKRGDAGLRREERKLECERWNRLHQLIGSADGKKYRNFAQGLTFEMMVGQANRRLREMSDRYLLIRDREQPLELNVIDNYQAGETRSTKNLSGGESFIVSLALALGLAAMNGRNVTVDSLFLDEGFGALDEETLETALESLTALRHDGKVIGVISHVPALVERIGVRIQVSPAAGGRSVISGPGVTRG
ncbi:MAG: AAA family ATPase [Candidatus Adiutrix sp.]|jgi:exonuclease SbcC|nr:AAA family ATPase [Candidatus Adiutrix sp.]